MSRDKMGSPKENMFIEWCNKCKECGSFKSLALNMLACDLTPKQRHEAKYQICEDGSITGPQRSWINSMLGRSQSSLLHIPPRSSCSLGLISSWRGIQQNNVQDAGGRIYEMACVLVAKHSRVSKPPQHAQRAKAISSWWEKMEWMQTRNGVRQASTQRQRQQEKKLWGNDRFRALSPGRLLHKHFRKVVREEM